MSRPVKKHKHALSYFKHKTPPVADNEVVLFMNHSTEIIIVGVVVVRGGQCRLNAIHNKYWCIDNITYIASTFYRILYS